MIKVVILTTLRNTTAPVRSSPSPTYQYQHSVLHRLDAFTCHQPTALEAVIKETKNTNRQNFSRLLPDHFDVELDVVVKKRRWMQHIGDVQFQQLLLRSNHQVAHAWLMNTGKTTKNKRKKRPERCKHCALAVVRRSQNFSPCRRPPSRGAQDGQNLISWRWSLPSPTDPVWWRSIHAISSYRGNRPTNTQNTHTNKPTDRTDYNTLHH